MHKLQVISVFVIILWSSNLGYTQDFVFPEEEPVREIVNEDKRQPIYIPGKCGQNELYYPDNKDDWICDCSPGALYYPQNDACYKAYRQGPCTQGKYLVLVSGQAVSQCKRNPCRRDNYVKLNGICHQLGKAGGPCRPISEGGGVLGINTTTLEIECLVGDGSDNNLTVFNVPLRACPAGTRRNALGKCRRVA